MFAYVPKGNMLFSGTLRENLIMFTDSATDEQIKAALAICDYVLHLSGGRAERRVA